MKTGYFPLVLILLFSLVQISEAAGPSCTVNTTAATLNFGLLDPSSGTLAQATATVTITCTKSGGGPGINYTITETRSPNYLGGYRMRHSTVASSYINYTLTYPGQGLAPSGQAPIGVPYTITLTGQIQGTSYADAYATTGGQFYTDWINLNVTP